MQFKVHYDSELLGELPIMGPGSRRCLFKARVPLIRSRHLEPDPEIPAEENPAHPSTSRLSPSGFLVSVKHFSGPTEC